MGDLKKCSKQIKRRDFYFTQKIKIRCFFLRNIPIFAAQKIYLMANHSATKKSVRKSARRNERNRYQGKTTRNAIRDFKVIDTKAAALEGLPALASKIDKLAKRGIIHKNKAANLKSKLAKNAQALAK